MSLKVMAYILAFRLFYVGSFYIFKETCTLLELPVYSDHNGFCLKAITV